MMVQADGAAMAERRGAAMDYALLADYLSALGYPARLELLDVLRFPHTLGDIRITPRRHTSGGGPGRTAARPTIRAHVEKLVEADLVRAQPIEEKGRRSTAYVVNPVKLYQLTEEMRRLSVMHAGRGVPGDATGTLVGATPPARAAGPRLVLVHGVYEGRSYPLDARSEGPGGWVIGRRRGLPVSLDYDPYVSVENAIVTREGERFVLRDAPGSKNGTQVNWVALGKGAAHVLEPADVIGVGRSLLVFAPR